MKLLKIIIATALLVLPLSLGAQTKAETSLYGKTVTLRSTLIPSMPPRSCILRTQ